jgi:hypothetical protein
LVRRKLMRQGLPRFDGAQGAALALVVAGVCQIVMQVAYSYVDLGLISGRDMLLVGVLLGVVGRTFAPAPGRRRRGRRTGAPEPRAARAGDVTQGRMRSAVASGTVVGTEPVEMAARGATGAPRAGAAAPGNASSAWRVSAAPHAYASRDRDREHAGPPHSRPGHTET